MREMTDVRGGARVIVAVTAVAAAMLLIGAGCREQGSSANGNGGAAPTGPATDPPPATAELPSYWIESDFDSWIGKRWDQIDLIGYMTTKPSGMDNGTRYVVFYSRTCDHCEAMFRDDLAPDPSLSAMVTAVEVPDDKERLRSPDAWPMPPTGCELLELPLGVNWIIQTPLTLRIEDGIVRCATEGTHKECMGLPEEEE